MAMREIYASDELRITEDLQDIEPVTFWEQKQKEILTSVVDYNLDTLDSLIKKSTIDLKPKYQRRFRWDDARKSKLIESFFMNVPVPPVFLNEDAYGKYSVIDGKQRLTAVTDFLNDRFIIKGLKVFTELNGKKFSEIPEELQAVITTRPTMRAVIILRQSDPQIKFEVFERLNTGGIKLNAQEIRNSTLTGSLNDLILELSEDKRFHKLLGIKVKSTSPIYKEMKDAELVLRFFAFSDDWHEFRGGIVSTMDKYMSTNRHMSPEKITSLREKFLETIEKVDLIMGDEAFRRWNPETGKWRASVLAALYDIQMITFSYFDRQFLLERKTVIMEELKKLFSDDEFQKSINAAIPSYFIGRIEKFIEKIKGI
ncbi:DUF262 domain-containing protein [Deinococcus arenicola]|uniref:DUF262 domain-containing protein n=1 Tax=Deinococcus arenicola TaxID=2994950 RepID=A0ABU4DRN1_9DEIO|nr:DUF262 domain-containing protein [Deinococcus sp. ZS9-10]MDV6374525.1 DUF262 domain-containing protein [Deinococcus sp. ZS9-10]